MSGLNRNPFARVDDWLNRNTWVVDLLILSGVIAVAIWRFRGGTTAKPEADVGKPAAGSGVPSGGSSGSWVDELERRDEERHRKAQAEEKIRQGMERFKKTGSFPLDFNKPLRPSPDD